MSSTRPANATISDSIEPDNSKPHEYGEHFSSKDDISQSESFTVHSKESRKGREMQVFSSNTNVRLVAGCIALSGPGTVGEEEPCTHVLLITSKAHPKRWILPKGGCELDETPKQSALREAWEEGGIVGRCTRFLGRVFDERPSKKKPVAFGADGKVLPRSECLFFEVLVDHIEDVYPESSERNRIWVCL